MDEQTQTDVIDGSSPAVEAPVSTDASSAPAAEQGEAQQQSTAEQPTGEAAAPFQVPENDDDLKGQETNPHVQAIVQLRQELRARNQVVDSYKPLDEWKPVVEAVGDPQLAQQAYELISSIHSPSQENPSGFTSMPFLERIEQESPGTIDQIFSEICSFPLEINGERTTVVRELYKQHGLNPDRIDEYRNIDNLRASGVVTETDLAKIPEKYHEAFKALPEDARTDILSLKESNPALADQYLRNAERSLASERFEREQRERVEAQAKQEQEQFTRQVEQAVEADVLSKVKSWSDTIHQSLSQLKLSGDEGQNQLERLKILSTLATLQHPGYRFIAEDALKAVGASLDGFDDLINQWQESRSRYVTMTQMKDTWQARQAEAQASRAEQRILIKLNDYARRLAEAKGIQAATASQQTANQLETAQGRFVPSGNGNQQQGFTNPYEQNPHPVGTPEYYAFNRKVDREYQLTNASAYGG